MNQVTRRDIRVLKKKDIGDIARNVAEGKDEAHEIEGALSRAISRYDRSATAERSVLMELLEGNLRMARLIGRQNVEIDGMKAVIRDQNNRLLALERAAQV